jgi:hypothetical protein
MWTGPDFIASALGVAGLAWAIVSWSIARSADRNARDATANAADASKRSADALEIANELTKRMLEGPPPPWTLTYESPNGWQLLNKTGHVAEAVYIESIGDEFEEAAGTWDDVQPGGILLLREVKPFEHATIVVHWFRDQSHKITVQKP